MGGESERTSPLLLDFDAGLGLEMQLQHPTTVYSCDGISNHCEGSITSSDAFNTASQRRDCERQKKVTHKYSVPFPHELPFMSSNRPPPLVHNSSQRNWSGWDLSFSSSSSPGVTDPEPWRCKRTDGKKWRCSRDVAPDHKYCERHAHKSRTRSRKHVELPAGSCNNNATVAQQRSKCPTTMAASSADQTRCLQWKQPTHAPSSPSPSFRLYTESIGTNSSSVYLPPPYDDKQDLFTSFNSYIPYMDNHFQTNNDYHQSCDSIQGAKTWSLLSQYPNYTTQTFIDAWENEGKRFEQPSSTLSLSVSGGIKTIDEDQNGDMNSGSLRTRHEWMNVVGGPLGEALCLGNANTTRVCSYLASPQGYSNTDTTNSSKSNCDEDGTSHGF